MKRHLYHILWVTLASLLLLPGSALAQQQPDKSSSGQTEDQGSPRQRRRGAMQRQRKHTAMLAEKLNLTDTQKEQFQKINQDTRKQAMSIRQDSSLSDDQKKEKMQALRKQAHQQMFGVLTPEQKDKLKEMRQQHMKEQNKDNTSGDQASAKKSSDDDDGPGNNGGSL